MKKGTLLKSEERWIVEVWDNLKVIEYEVIPNQTSELKFLDSGKNVEFELIDEFLEPELYIGVPIFEGQKYAKLLKFI